MRSCCPHLFLFRHPAGWHRRAILPILRLATGLLAVLGVGAAALGATPVGGEFQVNTYTTSAQRQASVAGDPDGGFVVVWESFGSSGSDTLLLSIQGQRYDANGNTVGAQFQVNTYTTSTQAEPSVAADADGGFVIVWTSSGSASTDTSPTSVQGQRYDANGNTVGAQFQVNTYTTGGQRLPSVAADAGGDFVVVWESYGSAGGDTSYTSIQGQRYDASGNSVGTEFQVNTYATGTQAFPSVAADIDGNFVIVWTSSGSAGGDTSASSIQGQRYDASGNALGAQFQVNTYTTSSQGVPFIRLDADGDIVVVWRSSGSVGSDTSASSIQGQRYDASGNALGAQFQVNTYTTNTQTAPFIGLNADGEFVVVWDSYGSPGSDTSDYSIQGQRYDASGNAVGPQFQVNTYTTGGQYRPSVAVDADGDFVVVWDSQGSAGPDTSYHSILGQRYTVQAPPVPSLAPLGVTGVAVLLFGTAAAGLRGRLSSRS